MHMKYEILHPVGQKEMFIVGRSSLNYLSLIKSIQNIWYNFDYFFNLWLFLIHCSYQMLFISMYITIVIWPSLRYHIFWFLFRRLWFKYLHLNFRFFFLCSIISFKKYGYWKFNINDGFKCVTRVSGYQVILMKQFRLLLSHWQMVFFLIFFKYPENYRVTESLIYFDKLEIFRSLNYNNKKTWICKSS